MIERATRQPIEPMLLPSARDINQHRMTRFKQRINDTIESLDLTPFESLIEEYLSESGHEPIRVAAALAALEQGDEPLLLNEKADAARFQRAAERERSAHSDRSRGRSKERHSGRRERRDEVPMERFRMEVGYRHGVKPSNIVGAIANEADLDSRYIGQIEITDHYSLVDLPVGMDDQTLQLLRNTRVCGAPMLLSRFDEASSGSGSEYRRERPSKRGTQRAPKRERTPKRGERTFEKGRSKQTNRRSDRRPPHATSHDAPHSDAPRAETTTLSSDEPIAELIRSFMGTPKSKKRKKRRNER
jgi:ATP-dependent RNA helicase DeaD